MRDLVAVDGVDTNEITLIDSYGCPTEMAIMTSITKFSKSSKKLRTTFEAFKFPSSDVVQFRAVITPCLSSCKPVQCSLLNSETGVNQEFVSYGRRKRRRRRSADTASTGTVETKEKSHDATGDKSGLEHQHHSGVAGEADAETRANADVVVVGAIRITENFASLDHPDGLTPSHVKSGSTGHGIGASMPAGDGIGSSAVTSSASSQDKKQIGPEEDAKTDDCSNIMGLVIACIIFLCGQSILLAAWIYMYRMSSVYRSKFLAAASSSSSSSSSSASSCKSMITHSHHANSRHHPFYPLRQTTGGKAFAPGFDCMPLHPSSHHRHHQKHSRAKHHEENRALEFSSGSSDGYENNGSVYLPDHKSLGVTVVACSRIRSSPLSSMIRPSNTASPVSSSSPVIPRAGI